MVFTFATSMPIADTATFEDVYEEALRLDLDAKDEIVTSGVAAWMFVNGTMAGECYGIAAGAFDDDIEDVVPGRSDVVYCYSTTLLPAFQGRGLSKILVAYWNGLARGAHFHTVAGHATSSAMISVRASFGATFGAVHPRWYGTQRTAHFYEHPL